MSKILDAVHAAGWETKLSIGLISLSAVIQAVDAALKDAEKVRSHLPDFGLGPIWPYVPAILVGLAAVIWIYKTLRGPSVGKGPFPAWSEPYKFEIISGQTFASEHVSLDGKSFVGCKFNQVTLVYDGTAPYHLNGCQLFMPMRFHSNNPGVMATMDLVVGLGLVDETKLRSDNPQAPQTKTKWITA
jgi:hypothetical protein